MEGLVNMAKRKLVLIIRIIVEKVICQLVFYSNFYSHFTSTEFEQFVWQTFIQIVLNDRNRFNFGSIKVCHLMKGIVLLVKRFHPNFK